MFDPSAWLAAYHHAWLTHNAELLAQLFTEDAVYHAHCGRMHGQEKSRYRSQESH